jgi:hypothetical protein
MKSYTLVVSAGHVQTPDLHAVTATPETVVVKADTEALEQL